MAKYAYQFDDELRVVDSPGGYREVGLTKKIKAPPESLKNHIDAVRTFKDGIEILLTDFAVEINRQESEIDEAIRHGEFFLRESRKFHWNANPMFDRLRLLYTSQVDALRKEKRQMRLKKIEKKMGFLRELQEADKELSPFSKFF
jgi:hypothetical protein